MKSMLHKLWNVLGSVKLVVVLLLLLALLTYIGTLAQIEHGLYESQRRYFDSWYVLHQVRDLRIPLPGGQAVMVVLFFNLVVGGFIRIRHTWRLLGIYIVHSGIALLLLAGFVKLKYSDDGYIALYEGDSANFFESHHNWELAISKPSPNAQEIVIGETVLAQAAQQRVALQVSGVPFEVVIDAYAQNVRPKPVSENVDDAEVVEGFSLLAVAPAVEKEHDVPGAYLTVRENGGAERRLFVWGSSMLMPRARSIPVGDETWTIDLRKRRFPLPFTVRLDDFRKEDHPGMSMAKSYESDITQRVGRDDRRIEIKMNEPLRDRGYVLFQSGWGPQTPGPHSKYYSIFAVVRNPSDYWPLWSCVIIGLGLLVHFGQKLWRYVQREARVA